MLKRLPADQKEYLLSQIQRYFLKERKKEITEKEAEKILNLIIDTVGPFCYSVVIMDVLQIVHNQFSEIEDEIVNLESLYTQKTEMN